jgi:Tfp pilus assembly protein PilV
MKARLQSRKGFMLVEVLVALLVLVIIIASFTHVFSSGVTTIFTMGNKTKAVAQAQAVLDAIYQDGKLDYTDNNSNLSGFPIAGLVDEAALTSQTYNPDKPMYYSIGSQTVSGITYHKVTVLVFYQGGKHFATLTALIP